VRTLRTSEAAAYLNVSPNTLRAWEQRFGYPRPQRSPGRHRLYPLSELVALREALSDGQTVSSAISAARDAVSADEQTLTSALLSFDYVRADRAMERGLSLLPFEDAVSQLLLAALTQIEQRQGATSAAWAFAARWAEEWLARAARIAAGADSRSGVLFADCFGGRMILDVIHARVLEVFCVRAGVNVLRLPVGHNRHLERLTMAFQPVMLVLVGCGATPEEIIAFSHFVCSHAARIPRVQYRHAGGPGERLRALSPAAAEARREIVGQLARGA
jgi:MerR family transcriptional regulator, light-induced transcriptional regulator